MLLLMLYCLALCYVIRRWADVVHTRGIGSDGQGVKGQSQESASSATFVDCDSVGAARCTRCTVGSVRCTRQVALGDSAHRPSWRTHVSVVLELFCINRLTEFLSVSWPSVLWRCWLGVRQSNRPVKIWLMRCWRAYLLDWSEVQIACIWFSWCHCHPIMSASAKSRMVYLSGTDSLQSRTKGR